MEAVEAIRTRRSIRDYSEAPVPRRLVEQIIEDATHAPWTPLARPIPWMFTVIEGRARIAAFGERALDHARRHRPQMEGFEWTERPGFSVFHQAPLLVLISGRIDFATALEECTRAGQILTISAHARGLGSCWVGAPNLWLEDPDVRRELGVPEGFAPYACFTLGFRAGDPKPAARIQPSIIWNSG